MVSTGRLDSRVFAAARRIQELREATDYDAREIDQDQARAVVADAERFVGEVITVLVS